MTAAQRLQLEISRLGVFISPPALDSLIEAVRADERATIRATVPRYPFYPDGESALDHRPEGDWVYFGDLPE